MRALLEGALNGAANDFAHRTIFKGGKFLQLPHDGIGKQDLDLLHVSMLFMD